MNLAPMRYKNYVWPHNPETYEIIYERKMAADKVPFGRYTMQCMGLSFRVLRGEGEFFGKGAYDEFKRLATVFYDDEPGLLVHPVWQPSKAYFVGLSLKQEPYEDYVRYSFEFWEKSSSYVTKLTETDSSAAASGTTQATKTKKSYTVMKGDTLWAIAQKNGLTLDALLALNPQIKNPNLIYPGDVISLG